MDFDDDDDVVAEEDFLGGARPDAFEFSVGATTPSPTSARFPANRARGRRARAHATSTASRVSSAATAPVEDPRPETPPDSPPAFNFFDASAGRPRSSSAWSSRSRRTNEDVGSPGEAFEFSNAGSGSANGAGAGAARTSRRRRLWIRRVRRVRASLRPETAPEPVRPDVRHAGIARVRGDAVTSTPESRRAVRDDVSDDDALFGDVSRGRHRAVFARVRVDDDIGDDDDDIGDDGDDRARDGELIVQRREISVEVGGEPSPREGRVGEAFGVRGRGAGGEPGRRPWPEAPTEAPAEAPTEARPSPTPSPTPSPMSSPTPSPTPSSGRGRRSVHVHVHAAAARGGDASSAASVFSTLRRRPRRRST